MNTINKEGFIDDGHKFVDDGFKFIDSTDTIISRWSQTSERDNAPRSNSAFLGHGSGIG